MKCTFCGSGNRPENRFCGMCGVRIERRQRERRTSQAGNLQCAACSHVNDAGQKFCGMCGSRIERRVKERRGGGKTEQVPPGERLGRAVAQANVQLPSPEMDTVSPDWPRTRTATPAPAVLNQMELAQPPAALRREHGSTIGGPSFLGLSSDPQSDGEYLLEDESSGSGLRRLVLLVVLLAIAGLIFVQWRASYHANPKSLEPPKPPPATVPRPQGNNQPSPANTEGNVSAKNNPPAGIDAKTDPDAKAKDGAKPEDTETQAGTAAGTKDARTGDPLTKTASAAEGVRQSEREEKRIALTGTRAKARSANDVQDQNANGEANDQDQGSSDIKKRRGEPASRDKPSIALVKAQRYLQGRGVRQNCEQGMMYLKAATQLNDPNAAVQMAALYASGHCVQQDRVKAYQWFSSAYSQEPNNQWIAKNMNQLWGQMTPQQRRQFQ